MPYTQIRGRKPFERASKIGHSQIINNSIVQDFIAGCTLPKPPSTESLQDLAAAIPEGTERVRTIIAIDGGLTEAAVREEFPSATIAFMSLGPLLLPLSHLEQLEKMPFIAPEDMAALRNVQRYNLVLPTRAIRAAGVESFSAGVRKAVHDFLSAGDAHLLKGLAWLLFREWRSAPDREPWIVPRCPNNQCGVTSVEFVSGQSPLRNCASCGETIYLADALRLYERIDDEHGAGGILSYLLTALEQIVLVHLLRSIWEMKPQLLEEILFIKDGPLAFFGVTAPLYRPMRELMDALGDNGSPLIHLVGVEKSGPFVEHAAQIEKQMNPDSFMVLTNEYIYRYIVPGDSESKIFGSNTYYGAKLIVRGASQDTYVVSIPASNYTGTTSFDDLYNGAEILRVVRKLRCSMYDNALVPVVLANHLVSLADVPSGEILKKFAKDAISTAT